MRDGIPLTFPYGEGAAYSELRLDVVGKRWFILSAPIIGLQVKFDPSSHAVTVALAAHTWDSRTEGMCGKCHHMQREFFSFFEFYF